ncbi:tetratricopeptide repeat protein [Flaviramulus sp. BrNp1-15]|uniref:alpha/beta hydrolase-fold protein n=1 Tax=Flaviramulus sp. BrNp1-15 TaxID=2916754 RepID=UPI001EE7D100|nr:alpha/beta hydrolase-fold protein [Flaviramulus sp. BrNp1-15]ULC60480.1 tetratricopeptide repeat protein [Flaviramulus sp. BrNp1-15]
MKINIKYYLLILLISISKLFAQTVPTDIIMGKAYEIQSDYLENTSLNIQVSTPENYNNTEDLYPVLYILDGQWFFPHALSIRADFTQRNGPMHTPEFIVVGITTSNDNRWDWGRENASLFLKTIEFNIIKFIDDNYRTSDERILFGWETTGGFVIQTLSQNPKLFSAYIAASPAPLYGDYFKNLENEYLSLKTFLKNNVELNTFLFIGEGEVDYPVFYGTKTLKRLLNDEAPKGLNWHHKVINESTHEMCAYRTLQDGLKEYYRYFHYLTFNSKAEFERLGALNYIEKFYEKRQTQLSLTNDDESKHATRRNITFVAISENEYKWFDSLFTIFENDGFLEKSFAPHLIDYAQFYLKHKNPEQAKKILSFAIGKYPDNAQVLNALGDLYSLRGEINDAKKYYEKAIELGNKNNDWRVPEYIYNLKKL